MAHHTIVSARNGLKIAVPIRPFGTLARFATKGDNELIFEKQKEAAKKRGGSKAVAQDNPVDISPSKAADGMA